MIDSAISQNGDDAIEEVFDIANGNVMIDLYGDIANDGTGTAWEYVDAWARRVDSVTSLWPRHAGCS